MGKLILSELSEINQIDNAMQEWSQGDAALHENWFVHIADPNSALTLASASSGAVGITPILSVVSGLVVVSQTCDIVRSCKERPYVEVSPLVQIDPNELNLVKKGTRPRYAYLGAVSKQSLVIDLDRIMTIEKSILSTWQRTKGCQTPEEQKNLSWALARKRSRFAFPDDFNEMMKDFVQYIKKKHDKQSDEGTLLQHIQEIRVNASPSWANNEISITIYLLLDKTKSMTIIQNELPQKTPITNLITTLNSKISLTHPYKTLQLEITTYQDITAAEYTDSHPLDVDHLSH